MQEKTKNNRESGVSEVVGFIIILGIIMTGIGLVTLYGYPALLREQANANVKNMQRNMIVIQNDLKSLTYKNVPYKETSIQVSGGTLSLINPDSIHGPSFNIKIDGVPITDMPFFPGELRYSSNDDQSVISLENGGVHISYWADPQNGSAMLAEPRWFYDPSLNSETFVIFLIKLHGATTLADTGIGNVQMKLNPVPDEPPYNIDGKNVTVEYKPNPDYNYYKAWNNYFATPSLQMQNQGSDSFLVTYTLPAAKWLFVKRYNVEILGV